MHYISLCILCVSLLLSTLQAQHYTPKSIEVTNQKEINLLPHSGIYIESEQLGIEQVIQKKAFAPYQSTHFGRGLTTESIYFVFTLSNPSSKTVTRLFVGDSPVIENLYLYSENNLTQVIKKGLRHLDKKHHFISYSHTLTLPPNSTQTYYVKVFAEANPIEFQLLLQTKERFLEVQLDTLAFNLLFLGVVAAFMFYSFALSFYSKDRSYLFYALYLLFLLEHQATMLGVTQIYMQWWVKLLTLKFNIINISLLGISAILFAMSFLNTKQSPRIHKGYLFFIVLYLLNMLFLPEDIRWLSLLMLISVALIFYNLTAAIIIYKKGYKQARLFILGFGIVAILYMVMILDSLGVTTLMYTFYNAMLIATALEAFILLLAFADRYLILQKEKEAQEREKQRLIQEQNEHIKEEVRQKTKDLQRALSTKELLIEEIHHRVKNNLYIILSMIQLQKDETTEPFLLQKMTELEHRINAIAKTYNMLLTNHNIEYIEMKEYIQSLVRDIANSYNLHEYTSVAYKLDISGTMSIKDASYVGLIINELVTNAYKYAFNDNNGNIFIYFAPSYTDKNEYNGYILRVEDSGRDFKVEKNKGKLGLMLIYTLVEEELNGTIMQESHPHTAFTITLPKREC